MGSLGKKPHPPVSKSFNFSFDSVLLFHCKLLKHFTFDSMEVKTTVFKILVQMVNFTIRQITHTTACLHE